MLWWGDVDASSWLLVFFLGGNCMRMPVNQDSWLGHLDRLAHPLPMPQPTLCCKFFKKILRTGSLMASHPQGPCCYTGAVFPLLRKCRPNFSLKLTLRGSQSSFFEFSRQEHESHWLGVTLVAILLSGTLTFEKGAGVLKDTQYSHITNVGQW